MKDKTREFFEITNYTSQNYGGIAAVVIIYTAIYPMYGVKPYKISTIVDFEVFIVGYAFGVKPYKISTIVDLRLSQSHRQRGVKPYKISTIVDSDEMNAMLSTGVKPYKISTIVDSWTGHKNYEAV